MRRAIAILLTPVAAALALRGASHAFEVASIHWNQDASLPSVSPSLRYGRFTATRTTLKRLLAVAYEVMEPQVSGPDWLDGNRFDIQAKSPEGVPDSELPAMLQALLEDRFQLAAHLETRVMPVYHLVVGRNGVKMPVYPARSPLENDPTLRGLPTLAGSTSVSRLASLLAAVIGRPVIDKTELKERYTYFLSYAPLSAQSGSQVPELGPPDIFRAVEQQLGLKLETAKDEVRVVVVDHIEKLPTGN